MCMVASAAPAVVITFSTAPTGALTTYAESGFTFTRSADGPSSPAFVTSASYGEYLSLPGFSVVDVIGGLFQLGTFTYGNVVIDNNAGGVRVTGYLNGVSTFTTSFDSYRQSPQTRDPNAGSLVFDRVRFESQSFSSPALDNVTLIPIGSVPEPASWATMLGGFGLVGGAMRRRRTDASFA